MKTNNLLRIVSIPSLAFSILLLVSPVMASERNTPFKEIISFGDSLSDTGNIFAASGGSVPGPAYYEGRASNGLLWNEHLAEDMDTKLSLENNYSYYGAETGYGNYNNGELPFPLFGFADQVDRYLEQKLEKRVHPGDLFLVWVGANDFFGFLLKDGAFPIPSGIQNTVEGIESLLVAGARHVVVLNVPDLGKTPATADLPEAQRAQVSYLCAAYNSMLASALAELKSHYDFNLVVVDAFSIINAIIANPSEFGLDNVAIPASLGGDPATSLFWDGVHPTTVGHRILADFAMEALMESYQSVRSKAH